MKIPINIDCKQYEIEPGLVSAGSVYELSGSQEGELFLNRTDDIDIPLMPNDFIIIKQEIAFVSGNVDSDENPLVRNPISFRFNGRSTEKLDRAKIIARELKERDKEFPQGRLFADITNGPDAELEDNVMILVQEGDVFFVIPTDDHSGPDDVVDIEQCVKNQRPTPKRQRAYKVKIDGEKFRIERKSHLSEQGEISGRRILELVNKSPEDWALNQKLRNGKRERIKPDELVDIAKPGVERFETVRRQVQQGCE